MKILMEKREITTILINVICIKMLLTFPRTIVLSAGSASWIQIIYATLLTLLIYFITMKAYEKAGKQCILDLSQQIGGKWLKAFVGVVLISILGFNMGIVIRSFPESIKEVLLQGTNMSLIVIALGIAIGIGAYIGIEALGRINTIFLPIASVVLAIFLALSIPYCHINNLFPILGKGAVNVFLKGFQNIVLFSDIIVVNILLPYCKNFESAKKSGYSAILLSGILSLIIMLIYTLIFRYPSSTQFIMPTYQISRIVRIGLFFQRLEAFFEFVWSISLYMYGSIYIFIITHLLKKAFNLKYHKPIIFAVTSFIIAVTFIPSSMIKVFDLAGYMGYVVYVIGLFLPLVMALLYRIKCKRQLK